MAQASEAVDSWKSHPIYFVALGVAIGIGFAMTWLFPAHLGNLKHEVQEARRISSSIQESKKTIADLEDKLRDARSLAREAQLASLFHIGSPYPVGFGKVKVGEAITAVDKIYDAEIINKTNESYWSVTPVGLAVASITYFFDVEDKQQKITHLSINLSLDGMALADEQAIILSKLTEILGQPSSNPKRDFYSWNLTSEGVYLAGIGGYQVMRPGYRPGWWPKDSNKS